MPALPAQQHLPRRIAHLHRAAQVEAQRVGPCRFAVGHQQPQRDRESDALGGGRRGIGLEPDLQVGRDLDAVGCQQRARLDRVEHVAAAAEHLLHQRARHGRVGRHIGAAVGRHLQQLGLVASVVQQHAEGADGLLGAGVVRDARLAAHAPGFADRGVAEPAAQQPRLRLRGQRQQRARQLRARHRRMRPVDQQQRRARRVVRQQAQRLHLDVGGCAVVEHQRRAGLRRQRQQRPQRRQRRLGQRRQRHAGTRGRVVGQRGAAGAVAQHRQRVAAVRAEARQRLGGDEHLLQAVHPQHAGAREGGAVHAVGRGVGGRAGAHHDHRLVARRGPRGRQELARRHHRLQVQQDRARAHVAGEQVEQVAGIDVGVLAQRHHLREADAARARPVEHHAGERVGLRHEGEFARFDPARQQARVQPQVRREQPGRFRPEHAQQVRLCGVEHRLALLGREAAAEHDHRARAACAQPRHQAGHRLGRRAHQRQVRRLRQRFDRRVHAVLVEPAVVRVDRIQRPIEAGGAQRAPDQCAQALGVRRCADHRHRGGAEHRVEVAGAHRAAGREACRVARRAAHRAGAGMR